MLLFLTTLPLSLFLILSTCVNLSLQLYLFNSCVTFPLPLYLSHFSSTNLTLSLLLYLSKPVSLFLYSSIFVPLPLPLNMCHSFTSPLLLLLVFYLYSSMNLCHTSPTRSSATSSSCKHVRNMFLSVFFLRD